MGIGDGDWGWGLGMGIGDGIGMSMASLSKKSISSHTAKMLSSARCRCHAMPKHAFPLRRFRFPVCEATLPLGPTILTPAPPLSPSPGPKLSPLVLGLAMRGLQPWAHSPWAGSRDRLWR